MSLVTLPADADFAEIREVIDRDGGIIISNFASEELMDQMNDAIDPYFDAVVASGVMDEYVRDGVNFFPKNNVHVYGTFGKAPEVASKLLETPVHKQIMDHYLNDEYKFVVGEDIHSHNSGWGLLLTNAMRVSPGSIPQQLHRDQVVHCVPQTPFSGYATQMGCLIAGSDSTEANGATRVVPGSHKWEWDRRPKPEESVPAAMKKGSALFWLGQTVHGSGQNHMEPGSPNSVRKLYGMFGVRDYLRQEENLFLASPWETVKDCSTYALTKLGYVKTASGVGMVDLGHPLRWFKPLAHYRQQAGYDDSDIPENVVNK
ncbi:hypothetical protein BCR39DRAFT_588145 [Naematelia encephala]|uniref:Phytanoyl-CoA dioxygenase family protein n=1 Tax=Naematelia encephala TaxID=71784 RepID=A0A1Y2B4K7_9TREE|nr:hypothetical protein BCR39DRAFT_588145 [Naematelia encephala]